MDSPQFVELLRYLVTEKPNSGRILLVTERGTAFEPADVAMDKDGDVIVNMREAVL